MRARARRPVDGAAIVGREPLERDSVDQVMREREREAGRTRANETEFDRLAERVDELFVAPPGGGRKHAQVEREPITAP